MELKKLGHVMLDLETMANKSNAAIVSIGAVEFDLNTGETGREFYMRIDLQSALDRGLIINGSTVYWWLQQNEDARREVCRKGEDLSLVLEKFAAFMVEIDPDVQIWGNGARFDIGILEDAYVACGFQKMPWDFRKERDVRTLVSFKPSIKEHYPFPFNDIAHHPIADCKYQIGYCTAIWQKLNKD